MPELSALLGLHSLRLLEGAARRRNELVALYRTRLGKLPGIKLQEVRSGNRNSYREFSIFIDPDAFGLTRDDLATALVAENIDTRRYYQPPVHRQTAYSQYAPLNGQLPSTDMLSSRSLALPIWSHMETGTVADICQAVERIHDFAGEIRTLLKKEFVPLVA
jgi:dTDP-4-amino-4,6-dideoxygalactose transaminase